MATAAAAGVTADNSVSSPRSPQPLFADNANKRLSNTSAAAASSNAAAAKLPTVALIPPDSTPINPDSASSTILSNSAHTGLATFNASSEVQTFLDESVQAYIDARAASEKAATALTRFETTCSRSGGATGIQLPKSMQPQLVKSARFDSVADDPNFNRNAIQQLERVEQESSKQIHEIMLAAKKKLVKHLQNKANAHAFVNLKAQQFNASILKEYADEYDSNFAAASGLNKFPRPAAAESFATVLLNRVTARFTEELEARKKALKQKEEREAEERKAQEQMAAGVHNGANIRTIAQKEARKALDDAVKKKQVHFEQQEPASSAPSSVRTPAFHQHAGSKPKPTMQGRVNPPRPSWAPAMAPSARTSVPHSAPTSHKRGRQARSASRSPERDHRRHSKSPPSRRDHVSQRNYAGHKSNDRRDPHPATARRTDDSRSAQQPTDALPKNAQGGDMHKSSSQHPPHHSGNRDQLQSPVNKEGSGRERNSHGNVQSYSSRR